MSLKTIAVTAGTAALIAGAIFCSPIAAAHADDAPTPEPTPYVLQTWEDFNVESVTLDCVKAEFVENGTHAFATETAPGVWGEATYEPFSRFGGYATGDAMDSDCPNWQIDTSGDEPTWVNTTAPPAPAVDPAPVDDGIVWKIGLA